ncbi:MAG: hypothetical protein HQM02_08650, partial [Magnetococcales bacterium]|nr:hypothetical protein [Magnetococcales bacterium]
MADKLSKKQFRDALARMATEFRARIEAGAQGFDPDPDAAARRAQRATKDLRFFARTYFPHFVTTQQSVLHAWLFDRLPRLGATRTGAHLVIAAPRGEAKSTIVSRIFVLWRVVTGRSHYIPIIMDAYDQAIVMLESIKAELDSNQRLAMDFPQAFGCGDPWQEGVVVTRNNVKIQAFGSGKRMRGLSHGPHRPDLVICDDLENDENVMSRVQRDKLERWFQKTVLKLGPPDDSMDVVVVGTVLHHDSLLSRLLKNPMWESRKFSAIIRWPDNMSLWDAWEEMLKGDGETVADEFHASNRKVMEAGAVVSWPGVRPLVTLMKIRARDGHDAFDSELQNSPLAENALFANLQFWTEPDPEWVYFGAVDPSMGKSGNKGDPSAILVVGRNKQTGIVSVVEADIARRTITKQIERVIELQRQRVHLTLFSAPENTRELVKVTGISGNALTIERAQGGTDSPTGRLSVLVSGTSPTTDQTANAVDVSSGSRGTLAQLRNGVTAEWQVNATSGQTVGYVFPAPIVLTQ